MSKKKQITAIRDEHHTSGQDTSPSPPAQYISSLYLADSSLSADVSQYDFSSVSPTTPQLHLSSSDDSQVCKDDRYHACTCCMSLSLNSSRML